MANHKIKEDTLNQMFQICPQCGRKGLYHIKLHYHRCRFCGTCVIAAPARGAPSLPDYQQEARAFH
ncbi:MAG: hypothetical protein WC370_09410 [Dehalococcoidales bacterium]|jgi:ferredoxin-like protein FixX